MTVDSVTDGIVIDHITAGLGMELYRLLGLDGLGCSVAIITNVHSDKMGRKDIIKIDADVALNMDLLGYMDSGVTVNVIKGGKLSEKRKIALPERLTNVIYCKNPRCITSEERELPHIFKLTDRENRVYRCVYCEAKAKE